MTLDEAKKKIKAQAEAEWEEFKKSGSMLCQGFALGADDALETLDKAEPVGNSDKLTLKELARELRKVFRFKYLTCDGCGDQRDYCIWLDKPEYTRDGWLIFSAFGDAEPAMMLFESRNLAINLDLSEYADENGNIDYSKCIVEVEECQSEIM